MKGLIVPICESTNQLAKEHGVQGAPHGFWISADRQTEGRGRWGRQWASLEGNLFLSILLRPQRTEHWTWVPMAATLAVLETLHGRWPSLQLSIKWPNDLWLDGKKLAGVLCESFSDQQREPFLVLGLGLNLLHAPESLDQKTAALGVGDSQILSLLREEIAKSIVQATDRLEESGAAWVEELFWRHTHFGKGSLVTWGSDPSGSSQGKVLSLGKHGELWVESEGKRVALYAEEIRGLRSAGD